MAAVGQAYLGAPVEADDLPAEGVVSPSGR